MTSLDLDVLSTAAAWLNAGHRVHLFTVVSTWGSAPRLPGALLAVRHDGHMVGSVSGGCIEDHLADLAQQNALPAQPTMLEYGVSQNEAIKSGIPCGGRLQVFAEPLSTAHQAHLQQLIGFIQAGKLVKRSVHTRRGDTKLLEALPGSAPHLENDWFNSYFGPKWRLLIIGANQLGATLASMAQALEFDVTICDPREHMRAEWHVEGAHWAYGMPDDVVLDMQCDLHTAIVAVTHDPKLDDMALLEALKSDAFYVGALGAKNNQTKRRERLKLFDLSDMEIGRLHGPVGLNIGSRTPAEIAVAILAELVQVRSQMRQSAMPQVYAQVSQNAAVQSTQCAI